MHTAHPDVHAHGLVDGCMGCAQVAADPIAEADEFLLRSLVTLAVDRDRLGKLRSTNEGVAAAKILTLLEQVGRLSEVAGDVIADYLRERWRLDASIEPRYSDEELAEIADRIGNG